jgi:hypothetical protein
MSDVRYPKLRHAAAGVIAVLFLVGSPLMPAASAQQSPRLGAGASTYGGVTSQGLPTIVDVNATGRQATRVLIAIRLTCTPSGDVFTTPLSFRRLTVNRAGRYSINVGPQVQRNPDGTTSDVTASTTGRFNRARTSVAGTWHLLFVDHDAAGAVTDCCDSGPVFWRAKQ